MTTIIASALFLLGGTTTSAQGSNGSVSITGSVSPTLRLSLSKRWQPYRSGPHLNIESTGTDFVTIRLSGEGSAIAPNVSIPIEVRTNIGYTLRVTAVSFEGCSPTITASVPSLQASGPLVMQGAAEASKSMGVSSLSQAGQSAVLLKGPRISARGSFTSNGNALLAGINLDLSQAASANCHWSALIRISLEQ
jgi:hypothetical protein